MIYTFFAFFSWGLLPLYWKLLKSIPPFEILMHRILWSFIFLILSNLIIKNYGYLKLLSNIKNALSLLLCGLVIGLNWFLFIYAINNGYVVETSLGYYINPLLSILFGMIFLKEKLMRLQWFALILAFSGVMYLSITYGRPPWIALLLAVSFASYGLLKKIFVFDPLSGLTIETLFLFPAALIYLLFDYKTNFHAFLQRPVLTDIILILSGAATILPLYFFSMGAKRIPLSNVGFIQYISPSLMLLQGIFIYKEKFQQIHLISFAFIWTALIIYTITLFYKKN